MAGVVYVAGAGVIAANGHSWQEVFTSFQSGKHGIAPLSLFSSVHYNTLPVGEVKLSNEELAYRIGLKKPVTRTAMLGIHAAKEAYLSAGIRNMKRWRVGLVGATTVGGMDRTENFFPHFLQDIKRGRLADVIHHECGSTTELIADAIEANAFVSTVNTACSSSVNSIMTGARLIKHKQLDVVFAGGADALTKFTLNGFNSLMILDKAPCRPFDASRNGLNLGEGAGFVVLVSEEVARAESLQPLAKISGYANTNDGYHQTASSPEGRGSYLAMEQALKMAALATDEIDYINLHGTGTVNNDLSESTALKRLFGEHVPCISSTKAFTGHTLGACGGIETVVALMSICHQCVFPNLRFSQPIPETGLMPQKEFEKTEVTNVMSNSFGFGGNCSSIVLSKV